jgi:hypothetical protein
MAAAAEALDEDGFVERHAEALNAALARRAGGGAGGRLTPARRGAKAPRRVRAAGL